MLSLRTSVAATTLLECVLIGGFSPPSVAMESPLTVNVLVLNFDPLVPSKGNHRLHAALGFNDPQPLANSLVQSIATTSGGFINYNIAQWQDVDAIPAKVDGFSYTPDEYVENWQSGGPWHEPDLADYPQMLAQYPGLSEAIDNHEIDEVWVFGAPYFGYYESAMAGPRSFYINGGVYPDYPTSRPFAIMGFNYERQLDAMLHSLGHRAESAMEHFFGGWNITNPETLWDKYTANIGQTAVGPHGIGSIHYPANGVIDYDYSSALVVPSTAPDWLNYPNLTGAVEDISSAGWGGTEQGYMEYWYSHLPRAEGIHDGEHQLNNWWKYIYDFDSIEDDGLPRGVPRRGPTGHYYLFVEETEYPAHTWQEALDQAAEYTFGGYTGHLVTITSAAEMSYIERLIRGSETWLAGSDADEDGVWKWIAGPEVGQTFFANDVPVEFSAFAQGQPDGGINENYLLMLWNEYWIWNDIHPTHPNTDGFVVEFSVIPGDYDLNGEVDELDYDVWKLNFGSVWNLAADGNLNGVVDAADYAVWRDNFGQSVLDLLDRGAAVPEPSAMLLMISIGILTTVAAGRSQ
jgi:hypothetical protein